MSSANIREQYTPLARSVATKYIDSAALLDLTEAQLLESALRGAEKGIENYKRDSPYKLEAYLTWWMRRAVHIIIVERALDFSKSDAQLARDALLELLEK